MIVSINQPAYLPWLGYFDRIAKSDLHVVLDHVQFEKNGMINRNKIRTAQGWCWLTVPVQTKGSLDSLRIRDVKIANRSNWSRKHQEALRTNYSRAPFFPEYAHFFEDALSRQWTNLQPLIQNMNDYLLKVLSISVPILYSSELSAAGQKHELVLNICRKVGATRYLSGPFGRNYLKSSEFADCGIELCFHDYVHPAYRQSFPSFEPFMSVVDLLFNHGPASTAILMGSLLANAR